MDKEDSTTKRHLRSELTWREKHPRSYIFHPSATIIKLREISKKGDASRNIDKVLSGVETEIFRNLMTRTSCLCGRDLKSEPIRYYRNHPAGYMIQGEKYKCWLFISCKCGRDVALWKTGVPRE